MSQQADGFPFELERGGWMSVLPVAPHTFRVRVNETGRFSEPALVRYGIVRQPEQRCPHTVERNGTKVEVRTAAAVLHIETRDGQFRWCDENGDERVRTAIAPWSSPAAGFGLRLRLDAEEAIYGLGDVAPDQIERRGQKVEMWVAGTHFHAPIPFAMSSRGWALLMNTSWKHSIDIGQADGGQIRIEGPEGELDFYLFAGNDYGELLHRYSDIAGKPRLLPIWAYGLHYFCSVESGGRQVVEDALKFRQEGIPCDLIGLSDGWMAAEPGGSGGGRWDSRRFVISAVPGNDSSAFIDTLHRHGFKLSLLLTCNDDLSAYEERQAGGRLPSGTAADKTWFDSLRELVDNGVDGFKFPSEGQSVPHPERSYANGMSDNELHNLYPLLLGKQMHEGYRGRTGKRAMIHAVVGYTGMQQYTATECGKYGIRTKAVVSALNSGLSGHAHTAIHMHVDEPEGIHAGFLMPWAQNNSGRHFRHPCFLEEKQRGLFRLYARLRYRLLPYLYTAAHNAAATGMPIARAMPLAFPRDPHCRKLDRQYMLGGDLLVAAFTDRVYLPAGRWIDYWTGDRYEGPTTVVCTVPEQAGGPLFVRGGAIIPMRPDMDFIGQVPAEQIVLHIYPYGRSEFTLREDDGVSFRYADGQVADTHIQCEGGDERTLVSIGRRKGAYEGIPERRGYEIVVHAGSKPAALLLNGERSPEQTPRSARKHPQAGWKYDRLAGTVRLHVEEAVSDEEPVRLEIVHRASERPRLSSAEQAGGGEPPLQTAAAQSVAPARGDAAEWLHIALDTGDRNEVDAALDVWWSGRLSGSASAGDHWRTHLLDGCLLIVRHAERRGWTAGDDFGAEIANPLRHADTQTPQQALALLRRLAGEVIRAAKQTTESVRHPIVREIVAFVRRDLHHKLSLQDFADRAGIHPVYLSRLFKKEIGLPFSDYVLKQRMERAKALLESGMKVYEAASLSGFQDASHFSRVYSQYWGRPPVSFRRK